MCNSKVRMIFLIAAVCICFAGCSNKNDSDLMEVSTWGQVDQKLPSSFVFPEAEYSIENNFFPWTGTVSHHFLTDPLIDDWFKQIAERRTVKTFFIICPSHYGLSTYDYSVAYCKWNCGYGNYVNCNRKKSEAVRKKLGVEYDNQVFPVEHGAATMMPYITKYFPDADVVVVAIKGEPPVSIKYAQKLADVISPYFDENGRKENFLLISTDFSHHGNPEQTEYKDSISLNFFNDPTKENFIGAVCDNRPGIYVLSSCLGKEDKVHVMYHTNSFKISGEDVDDITSYYFSLFGSTKK